MDVAGGNVAAVDASDGGSGGGRRAWVCGRSLHLDHAVHGGFVPLNTVRSPGS